MINEKSKVNRITETELIQIISNIIRGHEITYWEIIYRWVIAVYSYLLIKINSFVLRKFGMFAPFPKQIIEFCNKITSCYETYAWNRCPSFESGQQIWSLCVNTKNLSQRLFDLWHSLLTLSSTQCPIDRTRKKKKKKSVTIYVIVNEL